ncbi:MAG: hypothetical protein WCO56_28200 [Verrucomicrobiota bacterium]
MNFFRRYQFVFLFLAVLVFCGVMVLRQVIANQSRHVELREAFILLHARGYTNEAQRLYQHLLADIPKLANKALMDDFQRTVILVDPSIRQPENLIWDYHWTISNELEKRSESTLRNALRLAGEIK